MKLDNPANNETFVLDLLGEPVKRTGDEWRYHSPFRMDRTPSFDVNVRKATWIDRSTKESGGCLVLAERKLGDNKKALDLMRRHGLVEPETVVQPSAPSHNGHEPSRGPEGDCDSIVLERFAKARGISIEALRRWGAKAARYWNAEAVCFPMLDADGSIIGNRYRRADNARWPNGSKAQCRKGDRTGLMTPRDSQASDDAALLVVEGEIDGVRALEVLGDRYRIVAIPGVHPGKGAFEALRQLAKGRCVYLLMDGDKAGRDAAAMLARLLGSAAKAVRVAVPPADHKDFDDYMKSLPQAERLSKASLLLELAVEAADTCLQGRSVIYLGPDEARVADQVVDALAVRESNLFVHGGCLVRVLQGEGRSRLQNLDASSIRDIASRSCTFLCCDSFSAASPPAYLGAALASRGQWEGVRELRGVFDMPVLLPCGRLLTEPGYDERSGFYLVLPPDFPCSGGPYNRADAVDALRELKELVADFPFAAGEDLAAFIGLLLTAVCRTAIDGNVPAFVLDAPVAGSGKTKLASSVAQIATGSTAIIPFPKNDEEMQKKLTTAACEGDRFILFDNAGGHLCFSSLDAQLTSRTRRDRLFGRNDKSTGDRRWHAVVAITSNNASIGADLGRRMIAIRLAPKQERPELRTGFRIPNIERYVREHRNRLYSNAIAIVKAFIDQGRPPQHLRALGSFEEWVELVPAALKWAGGGDMLAVRERIDRDGLDADRTLLRAVIERLAKARAPMTARQLLAPRGLGAEAMELVEAYWDQPTPKRLGSFLSKHKDRIIDGRQLVCELTRTGVKSYSVGLVEE